MRRFRFLALALCIMSLAACTEIFEKDIKDKEIMIYTPSGKDSLNYTQIFWWSQVDFATKYQLQVVYPNFAAPEKMILDTIVTTNRFPYYIGPGNFEWKVRAMNGAYKTEYFGNKFKIIITSLSSQLVTLKLPVNGTTVTGSSVTLTWDKLPRAVNYKIQVATESGFNSFKEYTSTGQSYSLPLTDDNTTYYWKVMASAANDSAFTNWSNPFIFTVKNTPSKVTLLSPENGATDQSVSGVTLSWNSLGADFKYNVYTRVGTSGDFSLYQSDLTTSSVSFTGSSGQIINWKVISKNKNGVTGPDSDIWSFKIK